MSTRAVRALLTFQVGGSPCEGHGGRIYFFDILKAALLPLACPPRTAGLQNVAARVEAANSVTRVVSDN